MVYKRLRAPPLPLQTLEPALNAVGSIAIVIEDDFSEYYPPFAAVTTKLFASGTTSPGVRNKALECFGMLCEAVGREKSGMDAANLLNDLIRALVSHLFALRRGLACNSVASLTATARRIQEGRP